MAGIILNRSRQVPAEDTPAFGGIAERFRRAGDLERAIALCREGLKKFPDQLSARVTLGWSLLDKGSYEEARSELERVLRRAPDNLAAIRGLAELHDRSEGAMPSMEERAGWRSDPAEPDVVSGYEAVPAPSALSGASDDPFAPISITLASATAEPSPEIVHTAEGAQWAAREAAIEAAAHALLGESANAADPTLDFAAKAAPAVATTSTSGVVEPFEDFEVDPLAAAAASLEIDAAGFDAGVPLGTAAVEQPVPVATSESAFAAEETDDLVATLQSFAAEDTAGVSGTDELLLQMPDAGEALDVELSAFEIEPVAEVASERTFATVDVPEEAAGEAALFLSDEENVAESPAVPALAAEDADVDLEPAFGLDADVAAMLEPVAAEATHVEWDLAPHAPLEPALAEMADVERDGATGLLSMDAFAEVAETAATADGETAAAPLADIGEIEPTPAFVPDLGFAIATEGVADAAELMSGIPDTVEAGAHVALETEEAEPEFVPDLSSVDLDGDSSVLEPAAMAFVEPTVPAPAALASVADADFVPDLGYAFEMVPDVSPAASDQPLAALTDVVTDGRVPAEVIPIDGRHAVTKSPLAGLERFLRQVESRRLHLASGSVA